MLERIKRIRRTGVLIFLAVGALTARAGDEEGIVRAFSIAPSGELVVQAERAKVEVRGGSDQVRVSLRRGNDDAAAIEDDYDIGFEQTADRLVITAMPRVGPGRLGWSLRLWRFRLRNAKPLAISVEAPSGFGADIDTNAGSVRVAEIAGPLQARTAGASVRIDDVPGVVQVRTSGGSIRHAGTSASVDANTSGGSIAIGHVQGAVFARTSGGRIAIEQAGPVTARTSGGSIAIGQAHGAVQAKTSGGSIDASLAVQPQDDSELRTSGGSIAMRLAPDIALDIDASSSGGNVRVEDGLALDGDHLQRGEPWKDVQATLNGGGPALRLRTSGGSIRLRQE